MKKAIFAGCLAVMMLLSMTMVLLGPVTADIGETSAWERERQTVGTSAAVTVQKETTSDPEQPVSYDEATQVCVLCDGEPVEMSLRDYLAGVVLAEMPPSFEIAALEAQAVAARTFVLRQKTASKHEDADVCADGSCCQQYLSAQAAMDKLGEHASQYLEKVQQAVEETDGLVVTYGGELIDAVYFSCSGGTTEDAVAVWGGDVPYLQSVESPGEEGSSRFEDSVQVPLEQFRETILEEAPSADLSGEPQEWFGAMKRTEGGGVDTLEIGGVQFEGTKLRSLFALRSTNFTVGITQGGIEFDTLGNGHRVGMSQYGAQAMAEAGADFREILTHYYTGVEIISASELSDGGTGS